MCNKRSYSSSHGPCVLPAFFGKTRGYIAKVFCGIIHAPDFTTRALCNVQESGEFHVGSSFESLRNVIHYRNAGSLDLVAKPIIALAGSVGRKIRVDIFGQPSCFLPDPQVFEIFRLLHLIPPHLVDILHAEPEKLSIWADADSFNNRKSQMRSVRPFRSFDFPSLRFSALTTIRPFDFSPFRPFDLLTFSHLQQGYLAL